MISGGREVNSLKLLEAKFGEDPYHTSQSLKDLQEIGKKQTNKETNKKTNVIFWEISIDFKYYATQQI